MDNNAIEYLTWKEQKLYREAENIHYFDGEDILRKITDGKIKKQNNEEERLRILRANKYELTYRYLMYLKKRCVQMKQNAFLNKKKTEEIK